MNWSKYIIASLLGGLVYFFAGWAIFGVILQDLTRPPSDVADVVMIPMEEFRMSYMIGGCLILGALHALVLMRWANISTWLGGFKASALMGGLFSLSAGLSLAAMYKINTLGQIGLTALGDIICCGLMGAAIGWYLGRNKS